MSKTIEKLRAENAELHARLRAAENVIRGFVLCRPHLKTADPAKNVEFEKLYAGILDEKGDIKVTYYEYPKPGDFFYSKAGGDLVKVLHCQIPGFDPIITLVDPKYPLAAPLPSMYFSDFVEQYTSMNTKADNLEGGE